MRAVLAVMSEVLPVVLEVLAVMGQPALAFIDFGLLLGRAGGVARFHVGITDLAFLHELLLVAFDILLVLLNIGRVVTDIGVIMMDILGVLMDFLGILMNVLLVLLNGSRLSVTGRREDKRREQRQ